MGRWFFNFASAASLVLCLALLVVGSNSTSASYPFGIYAAALAVLPAWRFIDGRRRDAEELRRIDYGLCRGCGYDLRDSAGRCPECGRPFQPHEKTKIRRDASEHPARPL